MALNANRGFGLIECLVALALVATALLSLLQGQYQTRALLDAAGEVSLATGVAGDIMVRLRANPQALPKSIACGRDSGTFARPHRSRSRSCRRSNRRHPIEVHARQSLSSELYGLFVEIAVG